MNDDRYHEGEIWWQEQAGERHTALRNGAMVSGTIMSGARPFVSQQRMLVAASLDAQGEPCASMLFGTPGFADASSGSAVIIERTLLEQGGDGEPWAWLRPGAALGLLAIELGSRRRLRVNGTVTALDSSKLEMRVDESYPNCPKYIQRRQLRMDAEPADPAEAVHGTTLDAERERMLVNADTLFVASHHPQRGADASHRGGDAGFLRPLEAHTIRIPDYAGNSMFNTLGNFHVFGRAGLAVPDFERGRLLQLTGEVRMHARLEEDPAQPSGGTGRYWDLRVARWTDSALPRRARWELLDRSPFNPRPTSNQ